MLSTSLNTSSINAAKASKGNTFGKEDLIKQKNLLKALATSDKGSDFLTPAQICELLPVTPTADNQQRVGNILRGITGRSCGLPDDKSVIVESETRYRLKPLDALA